MYLGRHSLSSAGQRPSPLTNTSPCRTAPSPNASSTRGQPRPSSILRIATAIPCSYARGHLRDECSCVRDAPQEKPHHRVARLTRGSVTPQSQTGFIPCREASFVDVPSWTGLAANQANLGRDWMLGMHNTSANGNNATPTLDACCIDHPDY